MRHTLTALAALLLTACTAPSSGTAPPPPSQPLPAASGPPPSQDHGVRPRERNRQPDRPVVRWNDPAAEGDEVAAAWKGEVLPESRTASRR